MSTLPPAPSSTELRRRVPLAHPRILFLAEDRQTLLDRQDEPPYREFFATLREQTEKDLEEPLPPSFCARTCTPSTAPPGHGHGSRLSVGGPGPLATRAPGRGPGGQGDGIPRPLRAAGPAGPPGQPRHHVRPPRHAPGRPGPVPPLPRGRTPWGHSNGRFMMYFQPPYGSCPNFGDAGYSRPKSLQKQVMGAYARIHQNSYYQWHAEQIQVPATPPSAYQLSLHLK